MTVFIDNCSLLQLVNSQGYGHFLVEIENLVASGNITLITHQHILDEWEKHKQQDKRIKEKKLLKKAGIIQPEENFPLSLMPLQTQHLNLQSDQIDRLLAGAILIPTPEGIKHEFSDRYRHKLAPFSTKHDSQNDWEIIGSAAQYCLNYDIRQLYFISANHTDFGDPEEPQRKIHPDIQRRFTKVRINFYALFSDFFQEMDLSFLPHNLIPGNIVKNEKYSYKSSVKKTALESLYHLFKLTYAELGFIPVHLLSNYFPFSSGTRIKPYYSIYSLYDVTDQLTSMFEQVEVDEHNQILVKNEAYFAGIADFKEKLKYVMIQLGQNLIFYLAGARREKLICHIFEDRECDCPKCSFDRFNFHRAFSDNNTEESDTREKFKQAYLHYKLGNYSSAAKLLLQVREEAYHKKLYIIYFLSQYNLRHLAIFLGSVFHSEMNEDLDVESIRSIDPIEECVKLKSHTDYEFLCYIAKGDFFSWGFQEISELVDKITEHYQSQLMGGWSSNNYVWQLLQEFTVIETTISKNFIMYDAFSNFRKLFELIIKGVLASHAMDKHQEGTFEWFDDYWIGKFLSYGRSKTIFRFFKQFKLKSLKYKKSDHANDKFIDLAENLLLNRDQLLKNITDFGDLGNDFFSDEFTITFDNVICMGTLLELGTEDLDRLALALLGYMRDIQLVQHPSFSAIANFLISKGAQLNRQILLSFLKLFSSDLVKYNYQFLAAVLKNIKLKKEDDVSLAILMEKLLEVLKGNVIRSNYDLIINLYHAANKEDQIRITKQIEGKLKVGFDFELYYIATIAELIRLNKTRLYQLLKEVSVAKRTNRHRPIFGRFRHTHDALDALLNICFKFGINTRDKRFNKFKKINKYYEWLVDMECFDYQDFEVEWINNYGTVHYYQAMSKSEKLRQVLTAHMKTGNQPLIEETFAKINLC